jgi:hypothetical protein
VTSLEFVSLRENIDTGGPLASVAQSPYFHRVHSTIHPASDHFSLKPTPNTLRRWRNHPCGRFPKVKRSSRIDFLWLRTFHRPVAVRVDVNADGTSRLTIKMTTGAGGHAAGHLARSDTYTLTREKTTGFLAKIEEDKFWELPFKRGPRL